MQSTVIRPRRSLVAPDGTMGTAGTWYSTGEVPASIPRGNESEKGADLTETTARKVLYLALTRADKRWTRSIMDWPAALNFFPVGFEGKVPV